MNKSSKILVIIGFCLIPIVAFTRYYIDTPRIDILSKDRTFTPLLILEIYYLFLGGLLFICTYRWWKQNNPQWRKQIWYSYGLSIIFALALALVSAFDHFTVSGEFNATTGDFDSYVVRDITLKSFTEGLMVISSSLLLIMGGLLLVLGFMSLRVRQKRPPFFLGAVVFIVPTLIFLFFVFAYVLGGALRAIG